MKHKRKTSEIRQNLKNK